METLLDIDNWSLDCDQVEADWAYLKAARTILRERKEKLYALDM